MIQPLETAFEYRHGVEQSLSELNEHCGLPGISNVKQCVRKIASRLQKGNLIGAVVIRSQLDVSESECHFDQIDNYGTYKDSYLRIFNDVARIISTEYRRFRRST